jgi:hypothetical protein
MATRDDVKTEQELRGQETPVVMSAVYEPPRILRKRSVLSATLQVVSGGCIPGSPGCSIGGT